MAVNEIFELNSMFIGDDRERSELEQQSRTLRTAIDQQEGRFLLEIDKMDEFRKDVKDFDESVRELEDAIHEVYLMTDIIDPNNDQYIRQMRDCMAARTALRRDIKAVESYLDKAILKLQSYSHLGIASVFRERIAMAGEEVLLHHAHIAQSQEDQNAAHQRLAEQREKLNELAQSIATITSSKESMLSSILALQDEIVGIKVKSEDLWLSMKDMQVACESNVSQLKQRHDTLQTEHAEAETAKQDAIEHLRSAQDEELEAKHELQTLELQHQELEEENITIVEQRDHKVNQQSMQQETNICLRATLRVLKEENLLMKSQESAIRQHTFAEKLELLSFETEELLSNVQETQHRTGVYRRQLAGEDESSPIHALLQQVAESQQRRKETIEKQQRLQQEIEALLAQQVEWKEKEEDYNRRARYELDQGNATLEGGAVKARGLAQQLKEAPTMAELIAIVTKQAKSLSNIQAVIEDQTKVLALKEHDFQHALQRLRGVQDELEMQRESQRVTTRGQEKRSKLKRMQEKRLSEYKQTIQEHEAELKNDNDHFQSTLLHQEELLQKRRDLLITQLESVAKITKQRTSPSSPDRTLQQHRMLSAPSTKITRGQSTAATELAVEKKRKREDIMETAAGFESTAGAQRPGQYREIQPAASMVASRAPPIRTGVKGAPMIRAKEQAANTTASEPFDFFVRPSLDPQQQRRGPSAARDNRVSAASAAYQRVRIVPPLMQRNAKRALEGPENVDNQQTLPSSSAPVLTSISMPVTMLPDVTPLAERGVKPSGSSSANKNKAKMRAGPKFGT